MKGIFTLLLMLGVLIQPNSNIQNIPSVEEVHGFVNGNNILVSYREGGPVYGTFYFLEIHFCPNGYGLYGRSSKQTVMGNYQNNNWREFGYWEVTEQNGLVGIQYSPVNGNALFVPIYKSPDGTLFINQETSMVLQGNAICM